MATFYAITKDEMSALIEPWGFSLITLPGVAELVWAKKRGNGIEMRVFSGINPNGESREKGADAVRIYIFWHSPDGKVYPIGGSRRVHRVAGWAANLKARMTAWRDMLGPPCPECGAPTIEKTIKKEGPNKGKTFFGCCTWKDTQCKGTVWP